MKRIIYIILIFTVISCKQNTISTYKLSNKGSSKIFDSVSGLLEYKNDNLFIYVTYFKNHKWHKKTRKFTRKSNAYYEQIVVNHFESEVVDTISVYSFAVSDTSFKFELDYEKMKPAGIYGFYDWSYNIKSQNSNLFMLTRKNLVDSTFREEFFYDSKFIIQKINFINSTDTLILGDVYR